MACRTFNFKRPTSSVVFGLAFQIRNAPAFGLPPSVRLAVNSRAARSAPARCRRGRRNSPGRETLLLHAHLAGT